MKRTTTPTHTRAFTRAPTRRICACLFLAMALLALTSCGDEPALTPSSRANVNPGAPVIKIGSKNFVEQYILGEMYALLLENAGYDVERKFNLGDTSATHAALERAEIDLYPEYTGTGLVTVLKQPTNSDSQAVYNAVAQGYKDRFKLIWLAPSPMNNALCIAITRKVAQQYGITTISQFVQQASNFLLVGPPDFNTREDGMPGLLRVYGPFTLKEFREVEPDKRYQVVADAQADAVVAFSTDGGIAQLGMIPLHDDKGLFPPYNVAPVVRQELVELQPKIADVLNALPSHLTDTAMQQLNYEVSGQGKPFAEVARRFLAKVGLIS
ncbi:MAG: quaternary ammonium transporter [Anaerolineae bacterium]|nr:quaternary ammonium transporter [Anaerolineae bacterium]